VVLNTNDAGAGSLRQEILAANAQSGPDTITFDPAVFATPETIMLTSGELLISDSVTMTGPGAGKLTISGNNASRVIHVDGPGTLEVTISALTVANGRTTVGPTHGDTTGDGAGIEIEDENVTLDGMVVRNSTSAGEGGGIGTGEYASLTLHNCTVSGNSAGYEGGGIYIFPYGTLVVEHSSITGNGAGGSGGGVDFAFNYYSGTTGTIRDSVISGNSAGYGGGIYSGSATFLLADCSISGNSAAFKGGGLYLNVYVGPVVIQNSTVSGNSAGRDGGGIYAFGYSYGAVTTSLTISNSTVSGNNADNRGGGILLDDGGMVSIQNSTITGNDAAHGGGLACFYPYGYAFSLHSSIIAGNLADWSAGAEADLFSTDVVPIDGDGNLIGIVDASNNVALTGNNLTGSVALPLDALLGPLADNGGPTKTHALLTGSPAIDSGNNFAGTATDQRGGGFVRESGSAADIGAYEVQPAPPRVSGVVVDGGAVQRSRVTSLQVTFSTIVSFTSTVANSFTLTRTGGGSVSFSASTSIMGGVTVVTLNGFVGSATEFGSLADGRYTLTVLASQITANGQQLDGNGDGIGGDNSTFGDAQGLFRFFGDVNGDQTVNGLDLGFFRNAFGTQTGDANYLSYLDLNGDGVINGFDLGQFRTRFGTVLP
jgi:hypothetical protein